MKGFNILCVGLLLLACSKIFAQQLLAPDDAIQIVLKNNYSILISKNETTIANNLATPGNAGMLPSVTLNASGSWSQNDTKQKFATGTEVNKKGAVSTGVLSGIALNWTLFDGMRMFAAYDRLKDASAMSQLALKIEIENAVEQVLVNYYAVVKQKQLIKSMENNQLLYEQRLSIAETKLKIGSGSKIDFLQAKVDMNEQKSLMLTQKRILNDLKVSLNRFLSRPVETEFDVIGEIMVSYTLIYSDLKVSHVKNNNQLLFREKSNLFYEHSLDEIRSQRYPKVLLNSNYNFSHTENQVGVVLFNQNLGLNAGLSFSWTIFNGLNTHHQIKNASLELVNSKLLYDETRIEMDAALLSAYNEYTNLKEILILEEENIKIAKENADVTLESFKLGIVNSVVLKEAQKSYEDALFRLVNVRYDSKVAETKLMKLNGALVK